MGRKNWFCVAMSPQHKPKQPYRPLKSDVKGKFETLKTIDREMPDVREYVDDEKQDAKDQPPLYVAIAKLSEEVDHNQVLLGSLVSRLDPLLQGGEQKLDTDSDLKASPEAEIVRLIQAITYRISEQNQKIEDTLRRASF